MLARLLLALSVLALAAWPARADDIRIYHGTVLNESSDGWTKSIGH